MYVTRSPCLCYIYKYIYLCIMVCGWKREMKFLSRSKKKNENGIARDVESPYLSIEM